MIRNNNILELNQLLINCQYLCELYILVDLYGDRINWSNLFNILTKSSPTSLFKFKFQFDDVGPELESLKLFFDNWKGRHPMLLQTDRFLSDMGLSSIDPDWNEYLNLIKKYEDEGIVKKYNDNWNNVTLQDFEWI